jgi:hypothetical protein
MRLQIEPECDVARTLALDDSFRRVRAGRLEIASRTQSVSVSHSNTPECVSDSPAKSACILATSHLDQGWIDKEG